MSPVEQYRRTPEGWESLRDGHIVGVTTPPPTGVIFGMNCGDGLPRTDPATRKLDFGSIPITRGPYNLGGLPAAFDLSMFNTSTGRIPSRRSTQTFEQGGGTAAILNGSYDARITSWAASIPSDTWTSISYASEPNTRVSSGTFPGTSWRDANQHIAQLLNSLPSRDWVVPAVVVSAKRPGNGVFFDEARMIMPFNEWGNPNFIWNWDNYGNPSGGTGLDGPYPSPSAVFDPAYTILDQYGFTDAPGRWGITEFNSPQRNFDPDQSGQAQYLTDYVNYLLNKPMPPRHMHLWTGDNGQWDQDFDFPAPRLAYRAFVDISA